MLRSEMFELGMMLRAAFKSPLPPFYKVGYHRTRNVPHFEKGGLGGICRGINTSTMP
jgi:hypothetical protein